MRKAKHNRGTDNAASPQTTLSALHEGNEPQISPAVTLTVETKPKPREIPKLSQLSRHILDRIALGDIEEFITDEWSDALSQAAEEALEVSDVSEGGLSWKERLPALRARFAVDASKITDQERDEMDSLAREMDADRADIRAVEVLTYRRSNSDAGVYVLRVIWPDHTHATSVYCANTTGPDLDRAALLAAYEHLAWLRSTPGINRQEAEQSARGLARRETLAPSAPVRERIRGGRLVPCADRSIPLSCTQQRVELHSMNECQELAMRSYWMRRSIS